MRPTLSVLALATLPLLLAGPAFSQANEDARFRLSLPAPLLMSGGGSTTPPGGNPNNPDPLTVTQTGVPSGLLDVLDEVNARFTAAGGSAPAEFTASGDLGDLSLTPDGRLHGTLMTPRPYDFTVTAISGAETVHRTVSFTVRPQAGTLTLAAGPDREIPAGSAYFARIDYAGAATLESFTAAKAGLTFTRDGNSLVVDGQVPDTPGAFSYAVTATDFYGRTIGPLSVSHVIEATQSATTPTVVDTVTVAVNNTTLSSISPPAGTQEGDLLVLLEGRQRFVNSFPDIPLESGWQTVARGIGYRVSIKRASQGDTGATFSTPFKTNADQYLAAMMAVRGVGDAQIPVLHKKSTTSTVNLGPMDVIPGGKILALVAANESGSFTWTWPASTPGLVLDEAEPFSVSRGSSSNAAHLRGKTATVQEGVTTLAAPIMRYSTSSGADHMMILLALPPSISP